jgi:hypothetical protein
MKAMLFQAEDRNLPIPQEFDDQLSHENAVKELLKNDAWRTELAKPVPIRRAWGAVGLFWTLLLDRLEAQRSFNLCERCGRIIPSEAGKRFCGKTDNNGCFSKRRAQDQRRSRKKRASCVQVKGR